MTEVLDDGVGQLTFRQSDGDSFVHVGVADGEVTVGCSTNRPLWACLDAVSSVASDDAPLREKMLRSYEAHALVQRHDTTDPEPESFIVQLSSHWLGSDEFADKVSKNAPDDIAVIRVDVGPSSWQWDDFSFTQGPGRWSFGGLADYSVAGSLTEVVGRVGDSWVQTQLPGILPAIARFLEAHVL